HPGAALLSEDTLPVVRTGRIHLRHKILCGVATAVHCKATPWQRLCQRPHIRGEGPVLPPKPLLCQHLHHLAAGRRIATRIENFASSRPSRRRAVALEVTPLLGFLL